MVNQAIVNRLESKLAPHRFDINFPTLDRYWQSIYHHNDLSPKPDDSLLTLGAALSRISTKHFAQSSVEKLGGLKEDEFESLVLNLDVPSTFVETSVYVHNNEVQGILVRYQINLSEDSNIQLESWFGLLNWVQYEPLSTAITKYHSKIQVNSLTCSSVIRLVQRESCFLLWIV